jgi:hypothetical protein
MTLATSNRVLADGGSAYALLVPSSGVPPERQRTGDLEGGVPIVPNGIASGHAWLPCKTAAKRGELCRAPAVVYGTTLACGQET